MLRSKGVSRREFLRLAVATAALFGLPLPACKEATEALVEDGLALIWLEGATCTGCSVSFLNVAGPGVAELLQGKLRLGFHETLMGGAGALAMEQLRAAERGELGDFLLLLDGAIPTGKTAAMTTVGLLDGKELSSLDLAVRLNDASVATLAVGTCASFGGIPSARPRPTGAVDLRTALGDDTIIRVPGCPPHPDWILTTAIAAAAGRMVDLDELGRPRAIFRKTVHDECPRRPYFDRSDFASVPGDQTRCFFEVGCKGPFTNADCPTRLWHEGRTCCIAANHPCIGCAAPGFIDRKEGGADYPISPIYA